MLKYNCLSINYWYLVEIVIDKTNIQGSINVLVVFIKPE